MFPLCLFFVYPKLLLLLPRLPLPWLSFALRTRTPSGERETRQRLAALCQARALWRALLLWAQEQQLNLDDCYVLTRLVRCPHRPIFLFFLFRFNGALLPYLAASLFIDLHFALSFRPASQRFCDGCRRRLCCIHCFSFG
ncbi:hypothetical protein L596_027468 [Steinernema carpocapsae]|uniref:Secreted protein n=1 Tax=Steinernema carpocapsae TaxID=34508 RepID=A0A4U5LVJ9_STECR|nr:hypothetical protein L596_027468 [Steinernema carpocapsae]